MTGVLSPANASLVRMAARSIQRDPKRSLVVAALVGLPVGFLTSLVFGTLFRASLYDAAFSDEFALFFATLLPIVVGTVVIAVFVASVRKRTQELGQLVVVGASRSQLARLVLWEAVVVVVPASIVFSLLGMVVVFLGQPNDESLSSVLVRPDIVVLLVPLLFGLGVALLAALVPANKAASVSPIAALNARVPASTSRWWLLLIAVIPAVGLLVWRVAQRGANTSSETDFYWGVAMVWAGFAAVGVTLPLVIRKASNGADRLPGAARLALRDAGRSTARSSSLAAVALAASVLSVMAVAGLESDRGVYSSMDARYVTVQLDRAWMIAEEGDVAERLAVEDAAIEQAIDQLGTVSAVADFEDLRQLRRVGPGYGSNFVAALTDEAITAFDLSAFDVASIPDGGAIILDGQDWPLETLDGQTVPTIVVDAAVSGQSGRGGTLPVALMRPADLATLPLFAGSAEMSAEEASEQAARFNPSVRLYVMEEPLGESVLDDVRFGRIFPDAPIGVAGGFDRYFGFTLDGFQRLMVGLAFVVIVASAVGLTKLGTKEADAQLQPMLDLGAAPSIRRRFLAMQAGGLVLVGGLFGSALGVVLFWIVTRSDASVPDPIVPWTAMAVLSFGAALVAAAVVAILFGPKSTRTAES